MAGGGMDGIHALRERQLSELAGLRVCVEDGDWEKAGRLAAAIDAGGYEVEGWCDLFHILRWQIRQRMRERSVETIRLLTAELKGEY